MGENEKKALPTLGNNPMVGATVAVAVAIEEAIKKVAAPHKCRQKLSCCLHFFFRIPSFSVIIKVGDAHGGFFYHQIDFFRSLGFFSVKVSQHSTGCFL